MSYLRKKCLYVITSIAVGFIILYSPSSDVYAGSTDNEPVKIVIVDNFTNEANFGGYIHGFTVLNNMLRSMGIDYSVPADTQNYISSQKYGDFTVSLPGDLGKKYEIHLVGISNYMRLSHIQNVFEHVANLDPHLVNFSASMTRFSTIENVINKISSGNSLFVTSGGNSGLTGTFPASMPNVVAVGATTSAGYPTYYTNMNHIEGSEYVKGADFFANGVSNAGDGGQGTSYSSPKIVGALALILSKNPGIDLTEAKQLLSFLGNPINSNTYWSKTQEELKREFTGMTRWVQASSEKQLYENYFSQIDTLIGEKVKITLENTVCNTLNIPYEHVMHLIYGNQFSYSIDAAREIVSIGIPGATMDFSGSNYSVGISVYNALRDVASFIHTVGSYYNEVDMFYISQYMNYIKKHAEAIGLLAQKRDAVLAQGDINYGNGNVIVENGSFMLDVRISNTEVARVVLENPTKENIMALEEIMEQALINDDPVALAVLRGGKYPPSEDLAKALRRRTIERLIESGDMVDIDVYMSGSYIGKIQSYVHYTSIDNAIYYITRNNIHYTIDAYGKIRMTEYDEIVREYETGKILETVYVREAEYNISDTLISYKKITTVVDMGAGNLIRTLLVVENGEKVSEVTTYLDKDGNEIASYVGGREEAAAKKVEEEAAAKKATEEAALAKKAAEESVAKKAAEESAAKKAAEEATIKKAEEEAAKKAAEEATAAKKAAEEVVAKKAAEEVAAKKAAEEAVGKKAAEEVAAKKAAEEAAAKKAAEEAAVKKAAEEVAAKKAAEEAAAKKAAEEAAAKKAAEEAAAKKAAEEVAAKKAAEESVAKKAAEEVAAKKAAEEATIKKAEEEAAKKAAEEATAAKKAAEEVAAKKAAEEAVGKKAAEEVAAKKAAEEAAKKAAEESAAKKTAEDLIAKKAAEEAVAKRKAEEAETAAKKTAEEVAEKEEVAKKAAEEAAEKEAAAKKTAEESTAKEAAAKKSAEEAAEKEAAKKSAEEVARKKEAEKSAAKKAAEEAAAKKAAEKEASSKKTEEKAAQEETKKSTATIYKQKNIHSITPIEKKAAAALRTLRSINRENTLKRTQQLNSSETAVIARETLLRGLEKLKKLTSQIEDSIEYSVRQMKAIDNAITESKRFILLKQHNRIDNRSYERPFTKSRAYKMWETINGYK